MQKEQLTLGEAAEKLGKSREAVKKLYSRGIAKLADVHITQTLGAVGTIAYMSPEQAEMSGLDIDTRTDVYSLGVVFAMLLPSAAVFAANSPAQRFTDGRAVPSIVAGLFIYAAIILNTPLRSSGFLGGLALTILMVPTVTRTAQEVLNLVPRDLREAGLAMGATQWKTVALVVVPAARSGLITATILGVARIAGETAPLLFTVGVFDSYNFNPFKGDQGTIPTVVWRGLMGGTPESVQRAWSAILVLLIVVLIMFVLARSFGSKSPKK